MSVDFSGGLTVFRTKVTVRSLGFTTLWMGGHSVLFLENYELEFAIEPTTRLGLNVGGELSIALGSQVSLFVDVRYYYSPTTKAEVSFTEILNLDEVIHREPIETIQEQMSPAAIEINPSFFRLSIGLKLRF